MSDTEDCDAILERLHAIQDEHLTQQLDVYHESSRRCAYHAGIRAGVIKSERIVKDRLIEEYIYNEW